MAGENTPVRLLQGGSTQEVASSGTVRIASGGSIQVASGAVLHIAAGGSFVNAGEIAISGDLEIPSGGTLTVAAGGSVQQAGAQHVTGLTEIASGGSINVAAGGSIQSIHGFRATTINLGGTQGRWAFGTVGLTSGVGTVATGLTRAYTAVANAILGEAQGAGSASHVMVDLSLSNAGSVIFRLGSVGGGVWAANGTIAWSSMGT